MNPHPYGSPPRKRKRDFRQSRRWRAFRLTILHRDLWQCQIRGPGCQYDVNMEVDHIVRPDDGGGAFDETNVRAACGWCNNKRNNPEWEASLPTQRARTTNPFLSRGHQMRGALSAPSPQSPSWVPLGGDYSRKQQNDGARQPESDD